MLSYNGFFWRRLFLNVYKKPIWERTCWLLYSVCKRNSESWSIAAADLSRRGYELCELIRLEGRKLGPKNWSKGLAH